MENVALDLDTKECLVYLYKNVALSSYPEISYQEFVQASFYFLCNYFSCDCNYNTSKDLKIITKVLKSKETFRDNLYNIPILFLTLFIKDGEYDSRNLYILKNINHNLHLNYMNFEKCENDLLYLISSAAKGNSKEFKTNNYKKYCKIAAASIIGGTLLGLTGGLIAPILAASSGIILGSAGATLLGTTAGVSIIGSVFGLTGATLTGYKMNKRSGLLKEFKFERITLPPKSLKKSGIAKDSSSTSHQSNNPITSLSLTIAISGWITKDCGFTTPWKEMRISKESYALSWESEYLLHFGNGINYLVNWAAGTAVQEVLQQTFLSALLTSISWPLTLISLASIIDNPWGVCFNRSQDAGKELANVLLSRISGKRPVTLIGFSLGARVIYHALNYLSRLLPPTSSQVKSKQPSIDTTNSSISPINDNTTTTTNSKVYKTSTLNHSLSSKTLHDKNGDSGSFKNQIDTLKLVKSVPSIGIQESTDPDKLSNWDRDKPYSDTNSPTSDCGGGGFTNQPQKLSSPSNSSSNSMRDKIDPRGIIEDIILIGAPIPASDDVMFSKWMDLVAGTVTNCYCRTDWLLKFLYRTSSVQYDIAGLQPIKYFVNFDDKLLQSSLPSKDDDQSSGTKTTNVSGPSSSSKAKSPNIDPLSQERLHHEQQQLHPRIINIDLTSIVTGHNDYVNKMPEILKTLGYHYSFYDD